MPVVRNRRKTDVMVLIWIRQRCENENMYESCL